MAISESDTIPHQRLLVSYMTDLDIMADLAGQVVAAAQLVVPLEGVDFLLDAIGINVAEERERIMEAGLAD